VTLTGYIGHIFGHEAYHTYHLITKLDQFSCLIHALTRESRTKTVQNWCEIHPISVNMRCI